MIELSRARNLLDRMLTRFRYIFGGRDWTLNLSAMEPSSIMVTLKCRLSAHLESLLDPLAERGHLAGKLLEVVVRRRDRLLEPARRRRHEVEPVLQTSAVALQLVQLRNGDDVTSGRRDLRDDVQRLLHSPRLLVQLRLDSLKIDKQASGLKLFCST